MRCTAQALDLIGYGSSLSDRLEETLERYDVEDTPRNLFDCRCMLLEVADMCQEKEEVNGTQRRYVRMPCTTVVRM